MYNLKIWLTRQPHIGDILSVDWNIALLHFRMSMFMEVIIVWDDSAYGCLQATDINELLVVLAPPANEKGDTAEVKGGT